MARKPSTSKRTRKYRDPRSRRLARYANCLLGLASGLTVLTASAFWGTGWHLYSFHYSLLTAIGALAAAALALLETARHLEHRQGFTGVEVAEPAPVPQWTGHPVAASPDVLVLPTLPQPVPMPAQFGAPIPVPARAVRAPAAPQRVEAPTPTAVPTYAVPAPVAAEIAAPTPSTVDDHTRELAGQP